MLIDFLQKKTSISVFIDFQDLDVFNGAIAYPSVIVYNKRKGSKNKETLLLVVSNDNYREVDNLFSGALKVNQSELFDRLGSWTSGATDEGLFNLLKRIQENFNPLSEIVAKPQVGIKTGSNSSYIFPSNDVPKVLDGSPLIQNYLIGREVKRYKPAIAKNKILIPYTSGGRNLELVNIKVFEKEYRFLEENRDKLSKRAVIDKGILKGTKTWYEFQQIKTDFPYHAKYIVYPDISLSVNFTFAKEIYYDMTCFGLPSDSESLLGVLNSKLITVFLNTTCVKARGGYLRLKSQYILNIPIPKSFQNKELKTSVESILQEESFLSEIQERLVCLIESKFKILGSKKLQHWNELEFAEFWKELEKARKKVSKR